MGGNMFMMKRRAVSLFGMILAASLMAGCALMSVYDPTSYKMATDLKAQAVALVNEASDPPGAHAQEIKDLSLKMQQAFEYERGKGDPNRFTVLQWGKLIDPHAGLVGDFLRKWQADNAPEKPALIKDALTNIGPAFDEIIKLENYKVKN